MNESFTSAMRKMATAAVLLATLVLPCAVRADSAPAASERPAYVPEEFANIGIDEHPNAQVPLDLVFVDDKGESIQLRDLFTGQRPIVLQLGYYGCPMLCGLVTKGVVDSVSNLNLVAGKDFDLVFISIDPHEKPHLAALKKQSYLDAYAHPEQANGFHFLVGPAVSIQQVTDAVGFRYKWVEDQQAFAHPAAIFVLTPQGRVSRYLYGVKFLPQTLRLSLVEAAAGKIGTSTDKFLLTCLHYDPSTGKYALAAAVLMRIGGALTALIVGGVLLRFFLRERHRHQPAVT